MMNKGGDEEMDSEMMGKKQSNLDEAMKMCDMMIDNPKMATEDNLMELKDLIEEHQMKMSGEYDEDNVEDENSDESDKGKMEDKSPSLIVAIGRAMKKGRKSIALFLFVLFGFFNKVNATQFSSKSWVNQYSRIEWQMTPKEVSRSTVITNAILDWNEAPVLSTFPVTVSFVACSSVSSGNTYLEVWNSTSPDLFNGELVGKYYGTNVMSYPMNYPIYLDQGLVIRSTGTSIGIFQLNWREK